MKSYFLNSFVFFIQTFAFAGEKLSPADQAYLTQMAHLKTQLDSRRMKTFTLSNKLEVLLIHDPAAQQSAAGIDVGIGSLMDPPDHRGLAHYLEHMLFLGTKKYPQVGQFDEFLEKNGGTINAETSLEHTNFHFEVNSSAMTEALDQFAQFFISPLFPAEFVERELKNIDSEYTQNLNQDAYRKRHLLNLLADPRHPQYKQFQGNLATLSKFSRKALQAFYKNYYSANLMKLAVITPLPLEETEKTIRDKFSAIPNRNIPAPKFSAEVVKKDSLPQLIHMKPIEDGYEMELVFSLSPYKNFLFSTPQTILTFLVNYEGKGSLTKHLKAKGLITEMEASPSYETYHSRWSVQFVLTERGFHDWEQVVKAFYSYIHMLQSEGLNHKFFLDMQKKAELDHLFNTPATGIDGAQGYSGSMQTIPPLLIEALEDLEIRYSPKSFQKILSQVVPENMQILLSAPQIETNSREDLFQIRYRASSIASRIVTLWKNAEALAEFHFPEPNPYLPEHLSFEGKSQEFPVEIRKDALAHLWIQEEHTFKKPKAILELRLLVPPTKDPTHRVLKTLFVESVEKELSEMNAAAHEAGYEVTFNEISEGYILHLSGYSDKFERFAKEVLAGFSKFALSKKSFNATRKEITEEIQNLPFESPYTLAAIRHDDLMNLENLSREELLPFFSQATFEQFETFCKNAFRTVYIRGFGFGQITPEIMTRLTDLFIQVYEPAPLEAIEFPKKQEILLPSGSAFHNSLPAKNVKHAWLMTHQFGKTTPERLATLHLGDIFLSNLFYSEMRTVQSLGYIVESFAQCDSLTCGYSFLIESDQDPSQFTKLAEVWIQNKIREMATMPDEEFEKIRKGALETNERPITTFEEKYGHFESAIFNHSSDWKWTEKIVAALKSLSKVEVSKSWAEAVSPKTERKVTVHVLGNRGRGKWLTRPEETEITHLPDFRGSMKDFALTDEPFVQP